MGKRALVADHLSMEIIETAERRLVVGLDGSRMSDAAVVEAASLGRSLETELVLVHAGDGQSPLGSDAVQTIERLRAEHADLAGLPEDTRICVEHGDAVGALNSVARTEDADLIVMATDGRDGFLDAFRGSHSERVLRQAPCPLLAIPESSYIGQAVAEEMSAAPVR